MFILWGTDARKKAKLIDTEQHRVIEQVHPSPRSAYKGFLGSKPFSQVNEFLRQSGRGTIDWGLDQRSRKPRRERTASEAGLALSGAAAFT